MTGLRIHGISLHSRYSPYKEAERFVDSLKLKDPLGIYVLIEPGLGYLTLELKKRFPSALFVELHCTDQLEGLYLSGPVARWSPSQFKTTNTSFYSFLAKHIPDTGLGRVKILECPPAERAFGETYRMIRTQLITFLQERRATVHTTGIFGHRWLFNSIKRILNLDEIVIPFFEQRPVVICAGGPSLSSALPAIARLGDRVGVWALPSALTALSAEGITPDMVIHTDAGYYAGFHLRDLSGSSIVQTTPLFSVFNSAITSPVLLLNTGSPLENFFVENLNLSAVKAFSHGIVAGTAMAAASSMGRGPIIFAGLDLAFSDILGHVRPHSFDSLFLSETSRFKSLVDIYYRRAPKSSEESKDSASSDQNFALRRYDEWFSSLPKTHHDKFFRLFPSRVDIPAFTELRTFESLYSLLDRFPGHKTFMDRTSLGEQDRRNAVYRYLKTIEEQKKILATKSSSFSLTEILGRFKLLEEFITCCCYARLFRIVHHGTYDSSQLEQLLLQVNTTLNELKTLSGIGPD